MWDHAADGLVEDAGWCAEVEGTTSCWVVSGHLAEVGMVLDCVDESKSVRLFDLSIRGDALR